MNGKRRMVGCLAVLAGGASMVLGGCILFEPRLSMDPQKARIDAKTKLYQAAEDADPTTRVHAIEAMADVIGERAGGVFLEALDDPNPIIRFAAAMAIGDVKYAPAKPKLLQKVSGKAEPNKLAFIALAYALGRMDSLSPAAGTELGMLLGDPEKDVRALVALVMGKMGEPSATNPMKAILADEQEPMVRIQLNESLAMLGDQRSASVLEAFTKSQFVDERLAAIPALAKVQYRRAPIILRALMENRQPPPVRVSAAGALAVLGEVDDGGYWICLSGARNPQRMLAWAYGGAKQVTPTDVSSLQSLAAISLGRMKRTGAVQVLHPLLDSDDGAVRVAAAMSILRLLGPGEQEEPRAASKPATRPTSQEAEPPRTPKLHTAGGKD